MSRSMLLAALVLAIAGCKGSTRDATGSKGSAQAPVAGPGAKAPAPVPDPEAPTADANAEGPAPDPDTETPASDDPAPGSAEAYRRRGDPAAGVDAFVFWGWSEDGRYYAFETYHHGSDMANCEGEAELTIVDAQTDRYAPDGHVLVEHAEPEAEVCDPPDLQEELAHRRAPRLERFGISAEYLGGPIALDGRGDHWSFTPPDGGTVDVSFQVKHKTDDPMEAADGAAFVLKIKQPGMSEVVVENGRLRRPWTLSYGLDEGMVFVGPKGRQAAIMVAQHQTMPEGVRTTWMSSGITLR